MSSVDINTSIASEKAFLSEKSKTYVAGESLQDNLIRELVVRTFTPFLEGGRGIELGCSDGYMTELLSKHVDHLDVVEGSSEFIDKASARGMSNVSFINSLFEELRPKQKYDYIFANYILEHVVDPGNILEMAKNALNNRGVLFIVVPNSRALSRQLAYHMGIIPDLKTLTPNDLNHGHRRVYDRVSLNRDLDDAGFTSIAQGGIMLKPLADFQMDKLIEIGILETPQIDGLYKLGLEYPDLCGSIYSICRIRTE